MIDISELILTIVLGLTVGIISGAFIIWLIRLIIKHVFKKEGRDYGF